MNTIDWLFGFAIIIGLIIVCAAGYGVIELIEHVACAPISGACG